MANEIITSSKWHNVNSYHANWDNYQRGAKVDDIKFPASPENIDSAATRYRYDYDENEIEFDDNARIANERITGFEQFSHAWEEGTLLGPHVHWWQSSANVPNWWMKWRAYNNGEDKPAWTEAIIQSHAFTYTSGRILQISVFPDIDMTGIGISGFIDIHFGRDTGNVSGLFPGADPLVGGAIYKEFDLHAVFDTRGSRQDFVK